ncbi:hypothetical protein Bca4012_052676 [Brassica carinata]
MQVNQAKLMLREDPMFKGDGVAHAKRFSNPCGVEYTSLESDNLNLDSPTQASPRLSSSSLNLNDESENISGSPSSRPLGVKKSKMKRKIVDQTNSVINTILEGGNNQFREQLKKSINRPLQVSSVDFLSRSSPTSSPASLYSLNFATVLTSPSRFEICGGGKVAMAAPGNAQSNTSSTQRVKVYCLDEDGKWDDRGTGLVSLDYISPALRILQCRDL